MAWWAVAAVLAMAAAGPSPAASGPAAAESFAPGRVAAGAEHTLVVAPDGTVWAWGHNTHGQLGLGGGGIKTSPQQVPGLTNVVAVAAGHFHSVALRADGTVWTWGDGATGKLGLGDNANRQRPVQVPGLTNVVAVAAGGDHTLALKADGTVWAFGYNGQGQLGTGDTFNRTSPVQVPDLSDVVDIAAGYYVSFALQGDGDVYAWGACAAMALPRGNWGSTCPSPLKSPYLSGITDVAAGSRHGLALTGAGTVLAWGENTEGQLGDGTTTWRTQPVPVPGLSNVTAVSAGGMNSQAVTANGTLWSWGANGGGQLGIGTTARSTVPVQTGGIAGVTAVAVGTSSAFVGRATHAVAMTGTGTFWAWGRNTNGQLGTGDTTARTSPTSVLALEDTSPPAVTWQGFDLAPAAFSPNGDGIRDAIWAAYQLSEPATVTVRVLQSPSGTQVRTVVQAQPQQGAVQIRWDGLTDAGTVAPDGRYVLVVGAADASGNATQFTSPEIVLDTVPPLQPNLSIQPAAISPNGDGVREETEITVGVRESAHYRVRVLNAAGQVAATLLDGDEYRDALLRWQGRDGTGAAVPDGQYVVEVTATDFAGNVSTRQGTITVDVTPPGATFTAWSPGTISSGTSTIAYTLTEPATVEGWIVDAAGAPVRRVAGPETQAGTNAVAWNGTDAAGMRVAPGVYRLRLQMTDAAGNAATAVDPGGVTVAPASSPPGSCAGGPRVACGVATIAAGPLTLTAPEAISWFAQLSGFDQNVPATVPLRVIDATGAGAGWRVTLAVSSFAASGGRTLQAAVLRVNGSGTGPAAADAPQSACDGGSSCTPPAAYGMTYPVFVPAATPAQPVRIFSAAPESGLGAVTLAVSLWLPVPASTEAGQYSSVLTFALASGP